MTAAPTRRRNDGPGRTLDPSSDRAARMLLLEDVVADPSSTATPASESSAAPSGSRSTFPFITAFVLALVLAGVSWILAGVLSGSGDSSAAARASVSPVPGATETTTRPTDLLLRLGTPSNATGTGTVLIRQEVMTLDGEVSVGPNGQIGSILIDASHLRALVEALEVGGLATLEVVAGDDAPPMGVQTSDWKEWSDRLRVRRAIRRAERLGGTLRLGVEASS